jgi:hypothetical protein
LIFAKRLQVKRLRVMLLLSCLHSGRPCLSLELAEERLPEERERPEALDAAEATQLHTCPGPEKSRIDLTTAEVRLTAPGRCESYASGAPQSGEW